MDDNFTNHSALPAAVLGIRREWARKELTASPMWCAVDLRDGNQALPKPMTPPQKLAYFRQLISIGFKEIEIGFPAASQDEWDFCRLLIEQQLIPEDVTVSVLTQARPHIIERTLEALAGIRHGIVHLYMATSDLFSEFVLQENRASMQEQVLRSVRQIREKTRGTDIRLEFSPEEFTDSDLAFVSALCDGVVEAWAPEAGEKVIINLPSTVERALPMHYADMIEGFTQLVSHRDQMIISLHAHNDMGCAVADTELALMAGGERVEGTLFGQGERAGNVDLVTLALNLDYLGIKTGLDFSHLEEIARIISELTEMPLDPRRPYAGELAFTAFAGSHQDAINKGYEHEAAIARRFAGWKMPYCHINPRKVGRRFQEFIRLTTQSGKGGIAHVLKSAYSIELPDALLTEFAQVVQRKMDQEEREYTSQDLWAFLLEEYVCPEKPIQMVNFWPRPDSVDASLIHAEVHVAYHGVQYTLNDTGRGPVAAFAAALRQLALPEFILVSYEEKAIGSTVNAQSITIVNIQRIDSNEQFYGIGLGENIVQGAAQAIVSALNRLCAKGR